MFKWMVGVFFPKEASDTLFSWRLKEVGFLEPFELWEGKTCKLGEGAHSAES